LIAQCNDNIGHVARNGQLRQEFWVTKDAGMTGKCRQKAILAGSRPAFTISSDGTPKAVAMTSEPALRSLSTSVARSPVIISSGEKKGLSNITTSLQTIRVKKRATPYNCQRAFHSPRKAVEVVP
jgi:hypothetical protein